MPADVSVVAGAVGFLALLAAIAFGGLIALLAAYQVLLAVAAFFHRPAAAPSGPPATRLVVLVPAHNEETTIRGCVVALLEQSYPRELYEIVVAADNCTDGTAAVARAAGAGVLVRTDPNARGKGRALRWAIDRILAAPKPPAAIVVIDADSATDREFLDGVARAFERGATVVQGESLLAPGPPPRSALRATAFLLCNRTRPAGRAALGLPCLLAGNAMAFRSSVLIAHPWDAFSSTEDLEYTLSLRVAGVRPTFASGAVVHSPAAPTALAADEQQLRWEGGKLRLARTWVPRLVARAVRERRPDLLETALELTTPPLTLHALLAATGGAVTAALAFADVVPAWTVLPWVGALAALLIYVVVGLRAAHAPAWAYRALAHTPALVLWKLRRLRRLVGYRGDTWVPTERAIDEHATL
jgi:Glycosyltransferase like family 2